MTQTSPAPTTDHLRALVLNAFDGGTSESARVAMARTVVEAVADLRDLTAIASGVLSGSAIDALRSRDGDRAAADRITARRGLAAMTRAVAIQGTADTPGLNPRPVDVGTGTTGLAGGLPLIRSLALARDFVGGGPVPVVPGAVGGNISGDVDPAVPIPAGAAVTIGDVGVGKARHLAVVVADIARQVIDFATDEGLALIDAALADIADRAAELYIGGVLVAGAGGTRSAGVDPATLGAAVDAAEAAASTAVNGAQSLTLLTSPANLAKVRRAVAASWTDALPHPGLAASVGVPAGTAMMVAGDAVHLFRGGLDFAPAEQLTAASPLHGSTVRPALLGGQVAAIRPFYAAVRAAPGIQLITGIPA